MSKVVRLVIVAGAALALAGTAQRSKAGTATYMLQGSKLEVRFVPEKSTILLGEPIDLVFSVTNLSDHTLHLMVGNERMPGANNRSRFALAAVRKEDRSRILPPPPPSGAMVFDAAVGPNDLLPHKPYEFRLFLPYELPLTRPGNYTIRCGKLLEVLKPLPDGGWDMRAKPDTAYTQLKTQLTILPADRAAMGRVIDHLGQTAIIDYNKDSRTSQAATWHAASMLAAIADERTIEWLVRLLACRDGMRKSTALNALSRSNDPAAYAALKSALATRGSDFDDCTTPAVAADSTRAIRLDAVRALTKCGYPAATALLKSLRNDSNEYVRLLVLQYFGDRPGSEADAVVREMAHDKIELVRSEAERFLRLRSSRNPT